MNKIKISTLYVLAGVVLPGTVMEGARFIGNGSADTKAANIVNAVPQMVQFPTCSLTSEVSPQKLAVDEYIESPFWFEEINELNYPDPFANALEPSPEPIPGTPEFLVTSILPHPTHPLAIVNSKPCSIGDMIDDRWKLLKINGEARTIILVDKSGKRITVPLTKSH